MAAAGYTPNPLFKTGMIHICMRFCAVCFGKNKSPAKAIIKINRAKDVRLMDFFPSTNMGFRERLKEPAVGEKAGS